MKIYLVKMKTYILFLALILSTALSAQTMESSSEIEHMGLELQIDSTYANTSIFDLLPSNVQIIQDESITEALNTKMAADSSALYNGFRIRIFLDSRRGAREASAEAIQRFSQKYPYINADRSYSAPNFKVSIGNFRTRLEAESFLREIIYSFPDAFIVREKFKYPSIGKPDTRSIIEEEL